MPRTNHTQLNVRSRFAHDRATLIAKQTGMTATQVVEEALRTYTPPIHRDIPTKLLRKGPILVRAAAGRSISLEEANAALEEERSALR